MKKLILTITLVIAVVHTSYAQPPQAFKYQAAVRDNTGEILQNQAVGIRISLHDATAGGTIIYQETFSHTTNQFGLVNLEIGNGTPTIGTFSAIDWGSNSKFLETEIDPTGGSTYVSMGTSEFLSVPYALYSATSGDTSIWNQNANDIYYENGNVGIGTFDPCGEFQVNDPIDFTFNGTGLNDLNVDYGGYNRWTDITYWVAEVTVTDISPNIFKWDNGEWEEDEVEMDISDIDVGFGVEIGFDELDGHTVGDKWLWTVSDSPNGVFIVKNGKVGIGTDDPITELDIQGQIKINDGNQGVDKVLVSDADGIATWAEPTKTIDVGNYGTVVNPATGKTWLDRNLGASQVATSSADAAAYGDLYQWGRAQEGHEDRNSATYSSQAPTWLADDGTIDWDGKFIIGNPDWLNASNDELWKGISAENNPCPSGFRIPTNAEWNQERRTWQSNNAAGAFGSVLKLPMGGYRGAYDGLIYVDGINGYYWSSSVSGINAREIGFSSSVAYVSNGSRADGFSVRCIKN